MTEHAIDQFRARVAPGLSFASALRELRVLALTAVNADDRTGTGDEVWAATNGAPVRFVVRREGDRTRTCLTVLPPVAEVSDDSSRT